MLATKKGLVKAMNVGYSCRVNPSIFAPLSKLIQSRGATLDFLSQWVLIRKPGEAKDESALAKTGQDVPHIVCFVYFLLIIFVVCPFPLVAEIRRDTAEDYRWKGYQEQQKGNLQDALSWYVKATSADPKFAMGLNDMGLVYEELGQDDLAEQSYLKAIKADEKYLASYNNLALLYKKKQNLVQAVEYFHKRVELGDPQDPWTIKAKDELKSIYLTAPFFKERRIKKLARKFDAQLVQEIRDDLSRRVSQAKELHVRGKKFYESKKYSEAVKAYDQALELTPENPAIVRSRKQALHKLNQAMVQAHVNEAMKSFKEGDVQKAQNQFKEVLTIIPDEPVKSSQ